MDTYRKRIIGLVGGSVLGQLMTVLSSPILSRLYSAEDFGQFSLYLAFCNIVTPAASLGLSWAIQRQSSLADAYGIFEIGLISTLFNSLIFSFLFFAITGQDIFGFGAISAWYAFIVFISILATSIFALSRMMSIKMQDFKTITKVTIIRNFYRSVVQVAGGLISIGPLFLIVGEAIGRSMGNWQMIRPLRKELFRNFSVSYYRRLLKENKNYPLFVVPSDLINVAATMLPLIFINHFYGTALAGMYGLVTRTIDLPVNVIGANVADVLYERVSRELNRSVTIVLQSTCALLLICIPGVLLAYFFGVELFSVIFGDEWSRSGQVLTLLLPTVVCQFCISPSTRVLHLIYKERFKLIYDFTALVAAVFPFFAGNVFGWNFEYVIALFAILRASSYVLFFIIILYLLQTYVNRTLGKEV